MNIAYSKAPFKLYVPYEKSICAFHRKNDWHRVYIEKIRPNKECDIRLVDYGNEVTALLSELYYLDDEFIKLKQGVIHCKLKDIRPPNGTVYTDDCINLMTSMLNNVYIQVINVPNTIHEVVMSCNNGEYIEMNSYLVQEGHAESTGMKSWGPTIVTENKVEDWAESKFDDNSVLFNDITKQEVIIKHFKDPSNFHIQFVERIKKMKEIQDFLPKYIDKLRAENKVGVNSKWLPGDMCVVQAKLDGDHTAEPKWYRGLIIDYADQPYAYKVSVVDEGHILNAVSYSKLAPIEDAKLEKRTFGAIKCHLTMVGPTDRLSWSLSAKDAFLNVTKRFEKLAASMIEDGESKGVVIYGKREIPGDALSAPTSDWININDYLVQTGYMLAANDDLACDSDANSSILTYNVIGPEYNIKRTASLLNDSDQRSQRSSLASVIDTDDELVSKLQSWLPNVPIKDRENMNVYVTHVDKQMHFYAHHVEQRELIDKMTKKINKKITQGNMAYRSEWYVGQPCLAMYSDGKYYRAEVRKVNAKDKSFCTVQLIDFGNVYRVNYESMYDVVMFPTVPKQATCYYLRNLQPKSLDKLWPEETIDMVYDRVVEIMCSIRVDVGFWKDELYIDGPIPFDIRIPGMSDLRQYLIVSGYAENIVTRPIIPEPDRVVKEDTSEKNSASGSKPAADFIDTSNVRDGDDIEALYFQQTANDPMRRNEDVTESIDCEKVVDIFGAPIDANTSVKYLTTGSACTAKLSNQKYGSFIEEPFKDKYYDMITAKYKASVLDPHQNQFYFAICKFVNPTCMLVVPNLCHLNELYDEMEEQIDRMHSLTPPLKKNIHVNLRCLARSEEHDKWYRSIIIDIEDDKYQVIFVDYMEEAWVTIDDLKELDTQFKELPIRVVPIKLHDVQRNQRFRVRDIIDHFKKLTREHFELFAKVVVHGTIPEVEIYADSEAKELFYEQMFDEGYYRRGSDGYADDDIDEA